MANEVYQYFNTVFVSGKITKIVPGKQKVKFILSCGDGDAFRKKKKLENGLIYRDVISVKFFDYDAVYYQSNFKVGDFVVVSALAQNVTDRSGDKMRHLEIWGLTMKKREPGMKDRNEVMLRGKIKEAKQISNQYILLLVHTFTEATRPNHRENTEFPLLTDSYWSDTPVGIRVPNAREEIAKYTKGTWVQISGFVFGQTVKGFHVERVIANQVEVIGVTQS